MGWLDNIEGKLDDALDDVKEEIGERLEQAGASLFGNGNEGLGGGEITLTVDGLPLEPYALTADSFLSQIGEYRFYCAVAVGVEAGSFLDKPAQWRCTSADGLSRDYAGKVTRIDQGRILPDGQEEWVLTVSSGLATLRQQSRYRIVHRRNVIELAEELLQEYGLTVDNRTHEHYLPMDWTAQVGETDLQFLQRLLAQYGIWFYSSLAEQGEVIVLADDQHGASRADRGELAVTAETGGSRSVAGHATVALRQSRRYYRSQPDRSRVHQQVCPSEAAALTRESQSSAGMVATQQTFFQSGSGDAHSSLTQARLEQERQQCRSHTILVSGAVGDLQAGQWLPVAGHGPCLITRATLTFSSPRNHQGNSPNGFTWEAELLPLAQPFRPALSAQISLPLVFPARVEAGGPYSHVDGMASRKARIDFDDGDQPLTESSPPLRQLQPHGSLPGKDGQATGWDWPLRNGAEVLLTCLNNDPDKPLILGYAPAASQPGPVSNRNAPENRILTPAGNLLNLNDSKEAQAITLNTPDGQCLLDLNANSESPLVTLACEQGALVMRAGQHQNIDVGKNSQIRIGSDSTTQVLNRSVTHTDSGVIHHQSQTNTHLTATDNTALESGKNLELYSAANSQLRVQGGATITARKGLASQVGGNLHLQATEAIDIGGDGSGDLTLHQGGGGITIKANGTVRLFGNTVTLKGQSGVTFNGDMEHGVPVGVKADSPLPAKPLSITAITELVDSDDERQLDSTFAYDQLVDVARKTARSEFILLMASIFGYDIPVPTYLKMRNALRRGKISPPEYKVVRIGYYPASFDNDNQTIQIHSRILDKATQDQEAAWELLTILMHEFGHYIDSVLRKDLADKDADGNSTVAQDARHDEGAKYAYALAFFDIENSDHIVFAKCQSPDYSGDLKVDYSQARRAIQEAQRHAHQQEGKSGDHEHFGAGRGESNEESPHSSFGHESIEDVLGVQEVNFVPAERKKIYFGNWLRDYSQLLVPSLVRKDQGGVALKEAAREWDRLLEQTQAWGPEEIDRLVGALPKVAPAVDQGLEDNLSRQGLTMIVDVLASEEFFKHRQKEPEAYKVDTDRLGVYKSSEHIDNPLVIDPDPADPTERDKAFEPWVEPGDALLEIDHQRCMKRYIHERAVPYVQGQLQKAMEAGRTAKGFRHFGAALHVLEDYFAHSNFVELSLRKAGYTKVLAWTRPVEQSPFPDYGHYPVVTGTFAGVDTVASLLEPVAHILKLDKGFWETFPSMPSSEPTARDKIVLILLNEYGDENMKNAYLAYLKLRMAKGWTKLPGKAVAWLMEAHTHIVKTLVKHFFYSQLEVMKGSIADAQTLYDNNPNDSAAPFPTDPSHTQLAKDHDSHPFHVLAVELAKQAVKELGMAMAAYWGNSEEGVLPNKKVDPVAAATAFFCHPEDCAWQDSIVQRWADANLDKIKAGEQLLKHPDASHSHGVESIRRLFNEEEDKQALDYIKKWYNHIFNKDKRQ